MVLKISDISNLPQVDEAIDGWEVDINANKKEQSLSQGDIVYKDIYVKLKGVLQPLRMDELELKDEAQRTWRWYWLHVKKNYPLLQVNQQVYIKGKKYKIMSVKDFSLNSYIEYEVILDYENE